jgi:hypothetical protein
LEVVDEELGHPFPVVGRDAGDVRRDDDVVEVVEGVVREQRFLFEDVEAGAGDPPVAERLQQRVLRL